VSRAALLLLSLAALPATAQAPGALMPLPVQLRWDPGVLPLDSTLTARVVASPDDRLERGLARALGRLGRRIGQRVATGAGTDPAARLVVTVASPGQAVQTPDEDESYDLRITPERIELTAPTTVGALRGLETLLQLVAPAPGGFQLPAATITDRPRFRWRGLLLDTSRHFMPPAVVKRTLDGMAVVKLNVLHWHLSDDQGFRVESLRHPRLHQAGSDGLYYTQQELREIVAYARDRGIRVVPEFDIPGHATSWFVGYPEFASAPGPYSIERRFGVFEPTFDPTREETYAFIDSFIGEMTTLFPDPYWHIGGDEVDPTQWNQNPRIQRFKRTRNLRDNEALQAHFNERLGRILTKYHRRMVGWDEILHSTLPSGTVIQSWRGTEYLGQAARQGLRGILSAPYYLDHMRTAAEVYVVDPLPTGLKLTAEEEANILGAEACMWAEQVGAETVDSRIWPRMAALAERFWSAASVRDVPDMYRRLSQVSLELERVGLTQEGHTARMLRQLTGRRDNPLLEALLTATMPPSFGQRAQLQRPIQSTPLTRLVDAARPDPWLRSRLEQQARRVVADPAGAVEARAELQGAFAGWQTLGAAIRALADTVPLAADGIPAAVAMGELGRLGQEALDRRGAGGSDGAWGAAALARLDSLAQPQGLLRLAGVDAVRTLVRGTP
jgi:hexosaminidase